MRLVILAIVTFGFALAYAVLRYHDAFFGVHRADQLPLYVVNKAVSFAALALIVLAVGARAFARLLGGKATWLKRDRRAIGLTGFAFAAVHSAMSLAMLSPDYYAKLYLDTGKLDLWGEVSMLAGVVAMALLVWQARLSKANDHDDRRVLRLLGLSVVGLTALHVAAMGWPGWFKPATWPGGLPPITLWSFAVALLGVGLGLLPMGRRRQ